MTQRMGDIPRYWVRAVCAQPTDVNVTGGLVGVARRGSRYSRLRPSRFVQRLSNQQSRHCARSPDWAGVEQSLMLTAFCNGRLRGVARIPRLRQIDTNFSFEIE